MAFFDVFFIDVRIIKINMAEKFFKSEKFQKVFYPILYLILSVAFLVSFCFIFVRSYYTNVYISGSSMMPTLLGGNSGKWNYGISDNHKNTIKNIKRFDVVLTYYPSSWNGGSGEEKEDTTYKIKRVWGFPGETISLTRNTNEYVFKVTKGEEEIYKITAPILKRKYPFSSTEWTIAEFSLKNKTFVTHADAKREFIINLDEEKQEYFVMGDNWSASSDSFSHITSSEKLTFDNLQGKMIAIQGVAKLENGELVNKQKYRYIFNF